MPWRPAWLEAAPTFASDSKVLPDRHPLPACESSSVTHSDRIEIKPAVINYDSQMMDAGLHTNKLALATPVISLPASGKCRSERNALGDYRAIQLDVIGGGRAAGGIVEGDEQLDGISADRGDLDRVLDPQASVVVADVRYRSGRADIHAIRSVGPWWARASRNRAAGVRIVIGDPFAALVEILGLNNRNPSWRTVYGDGRTSKGISNRAGMS